MENTRKRVKEKIKIQMGIRKLKTIKLIERIRISDGKRPSSKQEGNIELFSQIDKCV